MKDNYLHYPINTWNIKPHAATAVDISMTLERAVKDAKAYSLAPYTYGLDTRALFEVREPQINFLINGLINHGFIIQRKYSIVGRFRVPQGAAGSLRPAQVCPLCYMHKSVSSQVICRSLLMSSNSSKQLRCCPGGVCHLDAHEMMTMKSPSTTKGEGEPLQA
ncbi:hypothetical protein H6P81_020328 [Aristolochia fimbriata]|uniref:Uncharacterized protein n=1 Tax=Aristolochia fimbriata TaxID=158543 RepID=A0AAV7DYM0_ARIFI|nr:hypothetical protein H6P81_020328 [Aristolochia fimbriata]